MRVPAKYVQPQGTGTSREQGAIVRVSCGKMRPDPFGPVPRCSGSLQPSPSITGLATRGTGELLGYCASTSRPCGGGWTSGCKCVCRSRSGQTSQKRTGGALTSPCYLALYGQVTYGLT